jgi:4-hydroxybenzoate polyprenyltransferase
VTVNAATAARGYLDLCRISNLPSVWTNVLCAVLLAGGTFSWRGYLIPALSMSALYLAGMCLNDVCDAAHDAVHRPARPIPSGSVTRGGALLLAASLALAGVLALASASIEALQAAPLLVALIVWYDLDHKKNRYSVLLMAACRFLLFIISSLAVAGYLPSKVLVAAAIHFVYIVLLSAVARYENVRPVPFAVPVVPLMLAAISLIDGCILAVLVAPAWLLAGIAGSLLLNQGQKVVRGD